MNHIERALVIAAGVIAAALVLVIVFGSKRLLSRSPQDHSTPISLHHISTPVRVEEDEGMNADAGVGGYHLPPVPAPAYVPPPAYI
jgi:hypothetical protein